MSCRDPFDLHPYQISLMCIRKTLDVFETLETVVAAIVSAVAGWFRRDRKTDTDNREPTANQISSDGSTQVVARDQSTVHFGSPVADTVSPNVIPFSAQPWYDCPHLRPEHVGLNEINAVSAFERWKPGDGSFTEQWTCSNPGCSRSYYVQETSAVLQISRQGWCEASGKPSEKLLNAWRDRRMITEWPPDDPYGGLI